MRIGIHTGKIVGGIIGTKVVRYDIFGQDVLIANKMESNGKQGCVCVSEATVALLKQNQFIVDTLDFTEHSIIELAGIGKKIQSYLVEQIFMENSMGESDENYSHELSSNEDKDEEGSENESLHNKGFKSPGLGAVIE
jgi:class 3 adenylate cyclase